MTKEDDFLSEEDRKILNFMYSNMNMSPREVAEHFHIPVDQVYSILRRDLHEAVRNSK